MLNSLNFKYTLICITFILSSLSIQSQVLVKDGLLRNFTASPGDVLKIKIPLVNTTLQDVTVTLSQKDVQFFCQTDKDYSVMNEYNHPFSAKNWVTDFQFKKSIAPKETLDYMCTVEIPNDANLKGTYYFVLQVLNPSPKVKDASNSPIVMTERTSYDIGILIDINKEAGMDLIFENININYNPLTDNTIQKILNVTLSNKKEFAYETTLKIEIYDAEGNLILDTKSFMKRLYPQSCRDIAIDLSELKAGTYECVLLAEADGEFVGTNLTLTID